MRMTENTVWTGTSSQLKNLGIFIFSILIIPIPYAFWQWLAVKSRQYQVTTERLLITDGVLSKTTETLELYRVKDIRMSQPLLLRLFGLENIELITTELTSPVVLIDYIPKTANLGDLLRQNVEASRLQKRVREVDLE